MLLSSRTVTLYNLEPLYGIKSDFVLGSFELLIEELEKGNFVIYHVQASKLSFFPKSMLGFENQLFGHCVLVSKYEPATRTFHVIDPVVKYVGEISMDEIIHASAFPSFAGMNTMIFGSDSSLSSEERLNFSAERNYNFYDLEYIPGGRRALRKFREAVAANLEWDQAVRSEWVQKNSISIMSVIKMRELVWDSYRSTAGFAHEVIDHGDKAIEDISKLWNSLVFNLIKIGRQAKPEYVEAILDYTNSLEKKELGFLEFVYHNTTLKLMKS